MTYNATNGSMLALVQCPNIVEWHDEDDGLHNALVSKKRIFMDRKVYDLLIGNSVHVAGFPDLECRKILARFINGHHLNYAMSGPYDHKISSNPDIERLVGVNETWVLCARKPRPGWRFFGRFASKDCLVILATYEKRMVDNQASVIAAATSMITHWNELFGVACFEGKEKFDDYYSGYATNIHPTQG